MNDFRDETISISGKTYTASDIANEKDEFIRLEAAELSFALNRLVYDSSYLVRSAVARKKVGLEKLAGDSHWRVRATVAKYCVDEDIIERLIEDDNDFVRFIMLKRGFGIERFVNDPDEEIAAFARFELQRLQAA
ncbi:MAG: hypothetical protein ACU833_08640 [Gammaproteobacteria bacterium]